MLSETLLHSDMFWVVVITNIVVVVLLVFIFNSNIRYTKKTYIILENIKTIFEQLAVDQRVLKEQHALIMALLAKTGINLESLNEEVHK